MWVYGNKQIIRKNLSSETDITVPLSDSWFISTTKTPQRVKWQLNW